MIKIAICDDELITLNHTKKLIENYKIKDFNIYVYKSGEELIESNNKFDTIFLDIYNDGNHEDTEKTYKKLMNKVEYIKK